MDCFLCGGDIADIYDICIKYEDDYFHIDCHTEYLEIITKLREAYKASSDDT